MLKKEFKPKTVLELGSNDGPFIKNFNKKTSFCVEPCDNFAKITGDMGYRTYASFWDINLSEEIKNDHGEMDLIYAANCICHIQDLDDCFGSIKNLLSKKGIFVFEDPSLLRMLERCSYDQIYDEHAHIFSVIALDNILRKHGLIIIRVDNLSVHGGSNRIYVRHIDSHDHEIISYNMMRDQTVYDNLS
jgi:methylation protein EvaC